jgi:hypothetical protein
MASLVTVKGPNPGRRFPLVEKTTVNGHRIAGRMLLSEHDTL